MLQASVRLYQDAYQGISRPIWWLSAVLLVNRAGTMVIPFLTVYLTSKGYTLGQAGFIMAVFGCGAILGGYIGGWLSDRFGFFYIQVFSLLLSGVMFIVLGYMQHLWQFAVSIFVLSSLGEAFRPANAAAVAFYSTEQNRTRSYSLNRLAVNLGWAIGPAIGGVLAGIDYALLFWVDGLTCIAAALLLYFLFAGQKTTKSVELHTVDKAQGTTAYKDAFYIKGLICLLIICLCFFQMFSILPVFYKNEAHLPEPVIGLILAFNGLLIAIIEMVLVYKLESKKDGMYYMITGALLIGVSFFILTIAPLLAVIIISMLIITLGEMLLFPFANNFWVSRSKEHNRGQYAALFTMTFALAQVLAPTIAAQVVQHWGFYSLFVVDLILCIAGGTGLFFLRKTKKLYGGAV